MVQAISTSHFDSSKRRQTGMLGGRTPPHNLEAEEALVGSMLLSRDAIATAIEHCQPEDFYKPVHGTIFSAVCSLYEKGEPVDPVTVAEELRRKGFAEIVEDPSVLLSLQASTPSMGSASYYATIVEESSLLRKLISVASDIVEMGFEHSEDIAGVVDRAESMIFDVASRRVVDSLKPIKDLLQSSIETLERIQEEGHVITGVPTGYTGVDDYLSGLQKSNLIVAVVAGITAYLVQDLFNTEQIALAVAWWLLLGCRLVLAGASDSSGKPAPYASSVFDTSSRLQDKQAFSTPSSSTPSKNHTSSTIFGRWGLQSIHNKADCNLPARHPKNRVRRHVLLACTCLAMAAIVATLAYGADGPWRADHDYWAATTVQSLYPKAARAGATETTLSALTRTFFTDINRATMLDPWEGTYPALAGDLLAAAGTAQHTGVSSNARRHDLVQAKSYLERAVRAVPISSPYHYELAEVMVDLAPYEPSASRFILKDAESQARLAVHWTPENHVYSRYLALIKSKLKST